MIYLDSAATTLQKPGRVAAAMARAVNRLASPGRGGYAAAQQAAQTAFQCREEAAKLFGLDDLEQVVFTSSATHGLNIAIKSVVKPGDTVLVSGYEHNAVTRPLYAMEGVKVKTVCAPLFEIEEMVKKFQQMMTPEVSAVVCTHVSNVFGYILPIGEIAALCKEKCVPLIVDASQSAGSIPVTPREWDAAFVAMPGHKGLYGPQGTGLLLCRATTRVLMEGGTGSNSLLQTMPDFLPDRLEAGTHNMPGIAGLLEGLRFVRRQGVERIGAQERRMIHRMARGLERIPGVRVFAAERENDCQSGVLSFLVDGMDCEQVGEQLSQQGFAVRCGLHCAPLAHGTAGTLDSGTVRASLSVFNTSGEVDRFLRAVAQIAL